MGASPRTPLKSQDSCGGWPHTAFCVHHLVYAPPCVWTCQTTGLTFSPPTGRPNVRSDPSAPLVVLPPNSTFRARQAEVRGGFAVHTQGGAQGGLWPPQESCYLRGGCKGWPPRRAKGAKVMKCTPSRNVHRDHVRFIPSGLLCTGGQCASNNEGSHAHET